MKQRARRNPEAGYALLFVYMMAASVAIMLYMELPRVAFEAQRDKEQLLIDRGEQYERGIQLYFRKFHQYPPTLDALDNTQNIRFLRRRYADPMTGKQDWRLIHVGAGGVLTDSLKNKGKSLAPAAAQKQTFVNEIALVGATNTPDANQPVNLAARRRPSETPGAPGSPGGPPVGADPNNPNAPVDPNSALNNAAAGAIPGQTIPGQQIQGANGASIVLPDGRIVPAINGLPGGTGQMPGGQAIGLPGSLPGGIPAQSNPYAQSSMPGQPGAPPQGAVNLINQLLTSPRQGGLNGGLSGQTANLNSPFGSQPGAGQAGTPAQSGTTPFGSTTGTNTAATGNSGTPITGTTGQTIGGGIAGVATKGDGEGIKVYNDSSKYKEWEFIYDLSKDTSMTGGQQIPQGQQLQQQNGLNGASSSNPLGNSSPQSSFGSQTQSGFGAQTPTPPPAPASTPQQ